MQRSAPWLIRLGAVLILISPFLPQAQSGNGSVGAWGLMSMLEGKIGGVERMAASAALFAPVLVGALLLAGGFLRAGGPPALRLAALGLLFVCSFAMATLGSLLFTDAATRAVTPSFTLAVALFVAPLLLSGVALARWMQGGLDRASGAFERSALAFLLILHGLFLADCGWGYLLLPEGIPNGTVHPLAGVWIGPLGGLLIVAGGLLAAFPPRSAVDTAPASG